MASILFVLYIPVEDFDYTGDKNDTAIESDAQINTNQTVGAENDENSDTKFPLSNSETDPLIGVVTELTDNTQKIPLKLDIHGSNISLEEITQSKSNQKNVAEEESFELKAPTILRNKSNSSLAKLSENSKEIRFAPDCECTTASFRSNSPGIHAVSETDDGNDENLTVESFTLEEALQAVLAKLGVEGDAWLKTDDNNYWQVSFVVETDQCDYILSGLTRFGFGNFADTSISLFPANFHSAGSDKGNDCSKTQPKLTKSSSYSKKEFIKSIKSRLTVAQVVEGVRSSSVLTFDYLVLIIIASIIAALGLAENSSVILVASMLVSPIMGPIMGGTFGMVIKNRDLWKLGIRNEIIGLTLCIVCGVLFGFVTGGVNSDGANWGSTDAWPTPEMQNRGMLRSLWVGILIALPSGAGVAISILGGNVGSLVGVAISASLLPPAVNAGMLWSYSLVTAIHPPALESNITIDTDKCNVRVNGTNVTLYEDCLKFYPPDCPALKDNTYEFMYSCYMAREAAIMGAVSLLLTLLNIACIFIMGILILKVKEVAPHTAAASNPFDKFWNSDIKMARDTYKTMKGPESLNLAAMAKRVAEEWQDMQSKEENRQAFRRSWACMLDEIEEDGGYKAITNKIGISGSPLLKQFSLGESEEHLSSPTHRSTYRTVSHYGFSFTPFSPLPTPSHVTREIDLDLTTSPVTGEKFKFDVTKLTKRKKNNRRPRYSRLVSCPESIHVPEKDEPETTGRFVVESIPEQKKGSDVRRKSAQSVQNI